MVTPMAPPRQSLVARLERRIAFALLGCSDATLARLIGAPIERDGQVLDGRVTLALLLARIAGKKGAERLGPERYRADLDTIGNALTPEPLPLSEVRELTLVLRPGQAVRGRLYVPADAPAPAPGLVYWHGGGFVGGSLDSHDAVCRLLARGARARVVSLEYRMAPEHPFPAALDDAEAGYHWVRARAPELGLEPERIGVGGDSAGGNLAAGVALALRKTKLAPRLQLLLYPALDLTMSFPSIDTFARGFQLESAAIRWFRAQYLGAADPKDPRASPWFAPDVAGAPPAIVVTAGFDPLRDEGNAYAERLREVGVPVVARTETALFHGFLHTSGAIPESARAIDRLCADLARCLRTTVAHEAS